MTQVLKGQEATLTLATYTDGTATDQGTFTIGIVDANDDEVVASGTPVSDAGDGTYTYTLAAQDDVAFLTATWTEVGGSLVYTTHVEIVGGLLFTEDQARAFQDGRLEEEAKFDDKDIAAERVRATDWLEANTGISWVPRYRRVTLRGNGTDCLSLLKAIRSEGPSGGEGALAQINSIISATVDGTALNTADIDIEGWKLWLDGAMWSRARRPNIVIEYEYGHRHLRNGVDRIALLELVNRLPASRLSPNAESSTDDFGSYGWAPQNNGRPSRNPEVNAWMRSQDQRVAIA